MTATPPDAKIATLVPRRDSASSSSRTLQVSKAKLVPPRPPMPLTAVQRHRQWLGPVLAHDVTLITAPLAYGKTVFAGQLYDEMLASGCAAAWVSCYQLPTAQLAGHIVEAVSLAIGEQADLGGAVALEALAVELANHIHDHVGPVLLCIDDIDQLDDGRDRDFLRHLIANCPTNLHLLATCRDDHDLSHLIEQRGAVLRIDTRVLRARDAEVLDYLRAEGVVLSSRRARGLNETLQGWWGALGKVAAGLRGDGWSAGPENWPQRCAPWIAPLFRESLAAMPARHRAALARCAVAPILTADLAVALTGDEGAGALLRDIARSGPLVGTVPGSIDRFAIQPALRAALLAGDGELPAASLATLRATAIDWHVGHGEPEQAIAIAGTGHGVERSAALIAQFGMQALERSGPSSLIDVLARIPPSRIAEDPVLARIARWTATLSGGDLALSADDGAIDAPEHAILGSIRLAATGNFPGADIADPIVATADFGARVLTAITAAQLVHTGNHRQPQELLRPIIRHGRVAGLGFAEAIALVTLADMHRAKGRRADAERLLQEGLADIPSGVERRSDTAAMLAVALADHFYLRNEVAMAGTLIDEALPVLAHTGLPDFLLRGYRVAIRVAAAARPDEALALIEAAEEIGADRALPLLTALGAVERMRLNVPLAASLDEILQPDDEASAITAPGSLAARTFALISEARAFEAIADLDRPRLTVVANRLVALAERADDVELRLIGTLLNVLPQLSGRCDRMVEIDTVKFLNHAASIGYIRPILDLLEITGVRTSQDFNRADYSAGSFLALLRLSRPGDGESLRPPYRAGSAFSFFTGREMEIVNALNEGETNKVIARKLGVTPETVKWHMKSLMRKLRASSREEVVSNALVLGVELDRNEHP